MKKRNEMKEADRVNNIGVMGIFLVTIINVALSTFGGTPSPKSTAGGSSVIAGGGFTMRPNVDGSDDGNGVGITEPIIYT